MIESEIQLLEFLQAQQITFVRVEHPAVYTCLEAEQFRPRMQGVSTKNLFLRDKRGNHYLLVTDCDKRMDLKALGSKLGVSRLHFGSEEQLYELLGVTRGAVTALGLVNDTQGRVRLLVDADIWESETFLCHPLVNTATLSLAKSDLERFFEISGHVATVMDIPSRDKSA